MSLASWFKLLKKFPKVATLCMPVWLNATGVAPLPVIVPKNT